MKITKQLREHLRNMEEEEFCREVRIALSFGTTPEFKAAALDEMERRQLSAKDVIHGSKITSMSDSPWNEEQN